MLGLVVWLGGSSREALWVVALLAVLLYLVVIVLFWLWFRGLGARLCSRNRHRLTWVPDVAESRIVHGAGVPLRSYIVKAGEVPAHRTMTVTSHMGTSFLVARQESVCERCGMPLPALHAQRHLTGWSV